MIQAKAPENEMVERMAQAIWRREVAVYGGDVPGGWDALPDHIKARSRLLARAALEELYEPTLDMIEAAESLDDHGSGFDPGMGYAPAQEHWRAMIATALHIPKRRKVQK